MKDTATYTVQHPLSGSKTPRPCLCHATPYRSRGNAEREAIAYAEQLARAGVMGDVQVMARGIVTWHARITDRYRIELVPV